MSYQLDTGACTRLNAASEDDSELFNTPFKLQIINIKPVNANTDSKQADRFRVIMSDGDIIIPALLPQHVNEQVKDGTIEKYSVVEVERFTTNVIKSTKKLFIVMGLRVLGKADGRIGNPKGPDGKDTKTVKDVEMADGTSNPGSTSAQPQAQVQPQKASSSVPSYPNKPGVSWLPIEGVSPFQNSWGIKARVMQKSDIRQWANQRGDGKLFSVTFMDDSGKIRATAFNNAVDAFYDKLQEQKVYYITKGRVSLAKKKFANGVENDYEITLDNKTEIEECMETDDIPVEKYNFTKLGDLEAAEPNAFCDVIAIIKEVAEVSEITTKAQKQLKKRELSLVDQTGFSVRLTLWGRQAEQFAPEDESPLYAFKGVKVGDFNGRSLSMVGSSTMAYNPEIKEAFELRAWYDGQGHNQSFKAQSRTTEGGAGGPAFNRKEMLSLATLRAQQDPQNDKPRYFCSKAIVMHIKPENIAYPGCPAPNCSKKVIESGGEWYCEKCSASYPEPEYRYIIQMAVSDYSGQAWFQGFNDVGNAIFGMTANELMKMKDEDEPAFAHALQQAQCQTFNFACRAKMDMFNDQARMRYGINKVLPLDFKEESKALLDQFTQWGL